MKHTLLFTAFTFLVFQCALAQNYILDNTFGTNGQVLNTATGGITTLVQQTDGKIIGCYFTSYSSSGNEHLIRFNPDGSIDTTFGTNGIVNTLLFNEVNRAEMIKLQSDGKILIVGSIQTAIDTSNNFGAARFNPDGTIDTSFGTNGYVNIDIANNSDWAFTVEIQTDGKILIGGYSSIYYSSQSVSPDLAVIRLSTNGILDATFSTNGKFTMNVGSTGTLVNSSGVSADYVNDICCDSFGNIFLGCDSNVNETVHGTNNFLVVALNSSGVLNTSFGTNGKVIVDFGAEDDLHKIQVTSDNKIIAGGEHYYNVGTNSYFNIAVVKLLSNGNYDNSFGTNGKVLINKDANSLYDNIYNFIIQTDEKLLCTGITVDPITNLYADFFIIRFNSDGTIDTTFNSNGYLVTSFNNVDAYSESILLQNDGKIILGGGLSTTSSSQTLLTRYVIAPLSTNNFDLKNTITISPNPFTDSITISTKDINLSLATIELYDISGRKISNFNTESTNNFTFSTNSNLSKGNYFLKITDQQTTQTFKLIKE